MITNRHKFGWAKEAELQPVIESLLNTTLKKSAGRYAKYDFDSEEFHIELKCRTCASDTYDEWLFPACKVHHASIAKKPTLFFYYFEKDKKLYMSKYEEKYLELEPFIPFFTKQYHVKVPADWWWECHSH